MRISPRLAEIVAALPIRPHLRVLEIGCGPGAAARAVADRLTTGHILAIDRSVTAIEQLKARAADQIASGLLSTRQVAIEDFTLADHEEPFDLIFAIRVGVLDGRREWAYVAEVDGQTAGVARLLPDAAGRALEVGLWLAADARGRGVGSRMLALLAEEARERGEVELLADTTTGNTAALAMLRRAGALLTWSAEHPDTVNARLPLTDR